MTPWASQRHPPNRTKGLMALKTTSLHISMKGQRAGDATVPEASGRQSLLHSDELFAVSMGPQVLTTTSETRL